MEFKLTGFTRGMRGKGSFITHVNYLGTTVDETPSHSNPKKDEYYQAKANYAKTGNRANLLIMSRDDVYLQRDIRTFSNIKGHSKRDFIADERKLMNGTGRKVKSIDFVVSPSPNGDKLNPKNPHDVDYLENYMTMLIHNTFNGYFTKTRQRTKLGYRKTRFYRTKGDRFGYYGVIQPDSHDSSNIHGHLTLFNYDFTNGNGMNRSYYGRNHIRQSVKRTTAEWNQLHPEHQMTGVNRKLTGSRKPTRIIIPVIQGVRATLRNPRITSQKKLIKALSKHHVQAKRLRKTKRRKHAAWKFRWTGGKRKHSWISSTRLSSYRGAGSFTAKTIDSTLHRHLVDRMNARKHKSFKNNMILDAQAPIMLGTRNLTASSSASSTSSSSSGIVHSSAKTASYVQNQTIAEHLAVKREHDEVVRDMPKLSGLNAKRYAYWNLKHAIPAHVVGYDGQIPCFGVTKSDRGLIQRMQGTLVSELKHLKRNALSAWHKGIATASNYVDSWHVSVITLSTVSSSDGRPSNQAKRFHHDWRAIKKKFNSSIVQPIMNYFGISSSSNASTSSAKASASETNQRRLNSLFEKPGVGMKAVRYDLKRAHERPASSEKSSDSYKASSQSSSLRVGAKTRASTMSMVHSHESKRSEKNEKHRENEAPERS